MKRMLVVFLLYITGLTSAWAQADSVNMTSDSTERSTTPVVPGHATPQLKYDEPFTDANSTILKTNEIPPSLRRNLESPGYEGWKEGSVRRHMQTGEYEVELVQGTEKKIYRFNQNGERVPEE